MYEKQRRSWSPTHTYKNRADPLCVYVNIIFQVCGGGRAVCARAFKWIVKWHTEIKETTLHTQTWSRWIYASHIMRSVLVYLFMPYLSSLPDHIHHSCANGARLDECSTPINAARTHLLTYRYIVRYQRATQKKNASLQDRTGDFLVVKQTW